MKYLKINLNQLIIIGFLFITIIATAQNNRFSFKQYKNSSGQLLNYRFLNPDYDTIRKYPLVVFLHGIGERGNDNKAQLKWGVLNFATDKALSLHPTFILAPQCPLGNDWYNYLKDSVSHKLKLKATPSTPMKLLIELIHQTIKNYPIDSSRIYITGLSSGGFGTFDAIERYPNLFAAAVPVCGAGDVTKASVIAHLPIWIFHGAEDAAVNPENSLEMYQTLVKQGARPGFTVYPEVGHFAWLRAYTDSLMMQWLFKQHK